MFMQQTWNATVYLKVFSSLKGVRYCFVCDEKEGKKAEDFLEFPEANEET